MLLLMSGLGTNWTLVWGMPVCTDIGNEVFLRAAREVSPRDFGTSAFRNGLPSPLPSFFRELPTTLPSFQSAGPEEGEDKVPWLPLPQLLLESLLQSRSLPLFLLTFLAISL